MALSLQCMSCVAAAGFGPEFRAGQHDLASVDGVAAVLRVAAALRQRLAAAQLQHLAARAARAPLVAHRAPSHPLQGQSADSQGHSTVKDLENTCIMHVQYIQAPLFPLMYM